jgi:hypothetical protein
LYHFLGVSEILENATFRSTVRKYVGGSEPAQTFQMMPWIDPTPSCPWVRERHKLMPSCIYKFLVMKLTARMMGQDRIESILRSHLETFKCRVELGTKLRSFEQHSNHVDVDLQLVITQNGQDLTEEITETACFDWVVGADGAHGKYLTSGKYSRIQTESDVLLTGVVRKALGLTFLGETREERMTTGDIHVNNLATDVCVFLPNSCCGAHLIFALFRVGTGGATWNPRCMYPLFLYFLQISPPESFLINIWFRMVLKPTENKESDVFQFFVAGQEVVSGMPAGAFGEVVWVSEYRSVNFGQSRFDLQTKPWFHADPTFGW